MKNELMKKIVTMTLASTMVIALGGCGSAASASENLADVDVQAADIGENSETLNAENHWGLEEFNYIMIPGEDNEKAVQLRNAMGEKLSEALGGLPVNIYHASDYNAAVESLRTGSAQMALLGPFSYVTAVERAGAECVCVTATDGITGYKAQFITQKDNDEINSLEDLKGKTFGFVDPASTSGNVVPCHEILTMLNDSLTFDEIHLDGTFFKSATFSGSHANSCQAVAQGSVDAAAVSSNTLANQIEAGNIDAEAVKIFYESPTIPGSPLVLKSDLPQEVKDIVTEFLLSYDDAEYFGGENKRYVAIEDSEYDYIRELQKKYGLED